MFIKRLVSHCFKHTQYPNPVNPSLFCLTKLQLTTQFFTQTTPQQMTTDQPPTQPQETDTFFYQPPTSQEYQFKIYINDCDSYIGSELVEQFRNDHIVEANPNIIVGSSSKSQMTNGDSEVLPSGVSNLIDISNQRLYNSVLLQADIILFTLNKSNIQEFEYILKLMKNATLQKEKRIVCISSFLSWGRKSSNVSSQVSKDRLHLRNPLDYHVKTLEDACLAISHQNQKVKGSVVFAGLVYGLGQGVLFSYFKRALQQQKPLEIYGKGTNFIPTIHLKDLSQIIQNVAFRPFQKGKNWHFASDSSKLTQKELITTIAENLGNGSVVQRAIQDYFLNENFDEFTLDIDVKDREQLTEWHQKRGLKESIESVVAEFNEYRGLKPNKILITGPPVSGKSTIAQILKKNYGLPVINIKSLIEDIKHDQSQFGKQIQTLLEQIRVQKVEEQRKVYEEMKKKKKGKGVEDFDPSKVVPRLPQQQLKRVIKWRLQFADCLNKGYILDSAIKTYKVAEGVFLNEQGGINNKIFPNSVFLIKAPDDQIKERVKGLPVDKIEGTHWTEEQTTRRLQTYAKENQEKPLRSFFDQKVDIKQVQINYQDKSIFAQFVQRNGPLGFKKQIQETKPEDTKQEDIQNVNQSNQAQEEQQEQEQAEQEQQVQEEFNLEKLTDKEQKILNEKSRPIRQYLIDNVIPEITEGLLQICKKVPEDPIDFLIGFLERKTVKKHK